MDLMHLDVTDPIATFNNFLFSRYPIETWDAHCHIYTKLNPEASVPTKGESDSTRLRAYIHDLYDAASPIPTAAAFSWGDFSVWGYGDPLDSCENCSIFAVNHWYVRVIALLRIEDDALHLSVRYERNDVGIDDDAIRSLFASL